MDVLLLITLYQIKRLQSIDNLKSKLKGCMCAGRTLQAQERTMAKQGGGGWEEQCARSQDSWVCCLFACHLPSEFLNILPNDMGTILLLNKLFLPTSYFHTETAIK